MRSQLLTGRTGYGALLIWMDRMAAELDRKGVRVLKEDLIERKADDEYLSILSVPMKSAV